MLGSYVGDEPVSSKSHVFARGCTVVTGVVGVTVLTSGLYIFIGNKVNVAATLFSIRPMNLGTVF